MSDAQGHPEEDFTVHWESLKKTVSVSSLDPELNHMQEVVKVCILSSFCCFSCLSPFDLGSYWTH